MTSQSQRNIQPQLTTGQWKAFNDGRGMGRSGTATFGANASMALRREAFTAARDMSV